MRSGAILDFGFRVTENCDGALICAVLTLPGWMVRESPSAQIRVVNPQFLPDAIRGRLPEMLSPAEVDLLSRQLEARCRDVEE